MYTKKQLIYVKINIRVCTSYTNLQVWTDLHETSYLNILEHKINY